MELPISPETRTLLGRRLVVLFKIGFIGVLLLLLHIPLVMTHGVLRERQAYRAQATEDIASSWGRRQVVVGPVLTVPYRVRVNVARTASPDGRVAPATESEEQTATAYFLPETLTVEGSVEPETRRRGIHKAVVYSGSLKLAASFQPDFAAAGIESDQVDWAKAELLLGLSDPQGLRSIGAATVNGGSPAVFGSSNARWGDVVPLVARIPGAAAGARMDIGVDLSLQGSERLDFLPMGKATAVNLRSPWAEPVFDGAYLPVRRSVGAEGFTASWETFHLSRGFGQSWSSRETEVQAMAAKIGEKAFGVGFSPAVDGYRMVERAQKYGVLFFILVFTVYYLFEVVAGLRIHPLQYALVGAALCLFFLGFLALSEFLTTWLAYAASAGICTLLIALYSWSVLRTGPRTVALAGSLSTTYAGLYFVLQSQDYALVAGTAAIFAGLSLVMYFTRRLGEGSDGRPMSESRLQ